MSRKEAAQIAAHDDYDVTEEVGIEHHNRLWPFQRADMKAMTLMGSCINGNEMGTGKTVETLSAAKAMGCTDNLIVCRRNLQYIWKEHITSWNIPGNFQFATFGDLQKHYGKPFTNTWDMAIFDEGHRLKTRGSKQSQGAMMLPARNKVIVTGTPVLNNPLELWSQLHILDPRQFTSFWQFVYAHCIMSDETTKDGNQYKKFVGLRDKERLHKLLSYYMIRRTKEEVLPYLPPVIYKERRVSFSREQRRIYSNLLKLLFSDIRDENGNTPDDPQFVVAKTALVRVGKLLQLCASKQLLERDRLIDSSANESPKTRAIIEILKSEEVKDQQAIVFTWYTKHSDILCLALNRAGIPTTLYNSRMTQGDRDDSIANFILGKYRTLVGTIGSLGEGHNLENAGVVIFGGKSWVPAHNEQAVARVHRGTTRVSPVVFDVRIAGNNVETVQDRVLNRKSKIVDETLAFSEIAREVMRSAR